MMKLLRIFLAFIFVSGTIASSVYADYVLPYPSYMPGNKLYSISRLLDGVAAFWHWGDIASYKYHLSLSDKYLVEAKTLFEYKQYFLAVDALRRSNEQFRLVPHLLEKIKVQGKDVDKLTGRAREAAATHKRVLEKLRGELPAEFTWTPEKQQPITLKLKLLLDEAIAARTL